VVAARYAHGLFLVTEKRGETARALEDLNALLDVLRPGTRVGRFLASPEVRLPEKRAALARALEGRALKTVAVFLDLLLRKKRMNDLATVVAQFEARVEKAQGIQRARVVSATPLTGPEIERLHRELERATGARIRLASELDPRLLGGALVRIGNRVIDRSVQTLIRSIGDRLRETSV